MALMAVDFVFLVVWSRESGPAFIPVLLINLAWLFAIGLIQHYGSPNATPEQAGRASVLLLAEPVFITEEEKTSTFGGQNSKGSEQRAIPR
jgi:hypothetical protein